MAGWAWYGLGMSNDTPSGYNPNQTIGQTAYDWAMSIKEDLAQGEINDETGYGIDVHTSVSVTIAGGGPGADITFLFDADQELASATLNYYEMAGSASYRFDDDTADQLATEVGARYALPEFDSNARAW